MFLGAPVRRYFSKPSVVTHRKKSNHSQPSSTGEIKHKMIGDVNTINESLSQPAVKHYRPRPQSVNYQQEPSVAKRKKKH